MSLDSSFSWSSNFSSVPMAIGFLDLMKRPPREMSLQYCSMNSSTVALLKRTLSETGARWSLRVSDIKHIVPQNCPGGEVYHPAPPGLAHKGLGAPALRREGGRARRLVL